MYKFKAQQIAEWDTLTNVVLSSPSTEVAYAQLAPVENLYDDFIDLNSAEEQHQKLLDALKSEGIKAFSLKELLEKSDSFRDYIYTKIKEVYEHSHYPYGKRVSSALRKVVKRYPMHTLWSLAMIQPRKLEISMPSDRRKARSFISVHSLGNLFYMRDQQIVTDKGLVMGNMKMPARAGESELTELGFESLGIKPIYRMKNTIEGGDFIPAGDRAFLGMGYRNSSASINELLKSGSLGYNEIVVVKQPSTQETMHLDTYFNIADEHIIAGDGKILRKSICTVFKKNEQGSYSVEKKLSFMNYLKSIGMNIAEVDLKKERFSTNFLTLKRSRILMPDNDHLHGVIRRYESLGIDVIPISVNDLLSGYGGVHCMTAVVNRRS